MMFREIDTKSAAAVRDEVAAIYSGLFPDAKVSFIHSAFLWLEDAFAGRYGGYQPIDTSYHNLEHTLQVTLCYARLLEGYKQAGTQPELARRPFELALLAILLHDTGYLKQRGDDAGTGAKYTLVHVTRSAEFAGKLLAAKGLPAAEIQSVQNMIRCTGVNVDLARIPFQNELEKKLGFALSTADLLGQMAAPDYIEKLGILYQEFDESNRFNGKEAGAGIFTSAEDLRRKTPAFWEHYVQPRINQDFQGLHRFLNRPVPDGPNPYLDKIGRNIARLQADLGQETAAR